MHGDSFPLTVTKRSKAKGIPSKAGSFSQNFTYMEEKCVLK
jgi:hypothetical protein